MSVVRFALGVEEFEPCPGRYRRPGKMAREVFGLTGLVVPGATARLCCFVIVRAACNSHQVTRGRKLGPWEQRRIGIGRAVRPPGRGKGHPLTLEAASRSLKGTSSASLARQP